MISQCETHTPMRLVIVQRHTDIFSKLSCFIQLRIFFFDTTLPEFYSTHSISGTRMQSNETLFLNYNF